MGSGYAKSLEDAFHQVAKDVVEWAGVRVTKNDIAPLPEHVEAIKNFPVPENITDMRSYWALSGL